MWSAAIGLGLWMLSAVFVIGFMWVMARIVVQFVGQDEEEHPWV